MVRKISLGALAFVALCAAMMFLMSAPVAGQDVHVLLTQSGTNTCFYVNNGSLTTDWAREVVADHLPYNVQISYQDVCATGNEGCEQLCNAAMHADCCLSGGETFRMGNTASWPDQRRNLFTGPGKDSVLIAMIRDRVPGDPDEVKIGAAAIQGNGNSFKGQCYWALEGGIETDGRKKAKRLLDANYAATNPNHFIACHYNFNLAGPGP